jgi:polysaccharide deacetylase 2 family uncharacterized protein YibQ
MIGLPRPDLPFLRVPPWAGASSLAVVSLFLLSLAGGIIGWLLVNAESTQAQRHAAIPRVVLSLPAPVPETTATEATEETAAPVPGIDFAMPLTPAPAAGAEEEDLPKAAPTESKEAPASISGKPPAAAPEALAKRRKVAAVPAPPRPRRPAPRPSPAAPAVPERPPAVAKPPSVPDPALLESSPTGPLPVIGKDGRKPWKVYARPFSTSDGRPRIAVVVSGLGLSSAATEAAIQRLPGAVTLAFAPYAKNLDRWTRLARAAGHEVLLDLPMEPISYPRNDPGPYTLLTSLRPLQNLDRVRTVLSRASGYVGVTNYMGSRFTTSETALRPVLKELNARGLLFLDSRASSRSLGAKLAAEIALPHAVNNRFLDNVASRTAIDTRLEEIERMARRNGVAVAVGFPYPVTIERLARWAKKVEGRGFALAPVSAVIGRQGKP